MGLNKKALEDLGYLGLSALGHCNGSYITEEGETIDPSSYGQYSADCEGFISKASGLKQECGNCKYWKFSGDYE